MTRLKSPEWIANRFRRFYLHELPSFAPAFSSDLDALSTFFEGHNVVPRSSPEYYSDDLAALRPFFHDLDVFPRRSAEFTTQFESLVAKYCLETKTDWIKQVLIVYLRNLPILGKAFTPESFIAVTTETPSFEPFVYDDWFFMFDDSEVHRKRKIAELNGLLDQYYKSIAAEYPHDTGRAYERGHVHYQLSWNVCKWRKQEIAEHYGTSISNVSATLDANRDRFDLPRRKG